MHSLSINFFLDPNFFSNAGCRVRDSSWWGFFTSFLRRIQYHVLVVHTFIKSDEWGGGPPKFDTSTFVVLVGESGIGREFMRRITSHGLGDIKMLPLIDGIMESICRWYDPITSTNKTMPCKRIHARRTTSPQTNTLFSAFGSWWCRFRSPNPLCIAHFLHIGALPSVRSLRRKTIMMKIHSLAVSASIVRQWCVSESMQHLSGKGNSGGKTSSHSYNWPLAAKLLWKPRLVPRIAISSKVASFRAASSWQPTPRRDRYCWYSIPKFCFLCLSSLALSCESFFVVHNWWDMKSRVTTEDSCQ